ncbi:hypothetical protein A5724_20150 [Mycobacterium sp. ACS1612]|uniref:class I SAM-dependent methyltransferase n=1 Tax=Mycobacterium sp. ACS1612 TaxID=1834117 RepID=UPI0007FFA1C4|nr:class I SAM-dependent methyltransferase [Mycobacterium sp. ACS1612]OBF32950.1 hypothetical protein A5724_20150 [Mycobacterium sp. ACS1612]
MVAVQRTQLWVVAVCSSPATATVCVGSGARRSGYDLGEWLLLFRFMSKSENMIQTLSKRAYFSRGALKSYNKYELMRTEVMVLLKYQPFIVGKDVLDIAIGAGRTTVYLAPLAKRYVGTDFSPTFVDFVKKTMPQVKAQLGDMRDLREFRPGEFDFVMISYNGIDEVPPEDRIKVLAEVHRVLKVGGLFVFSSHNRTYEGAVRGPKLELSPDPFRQAARLLRWLRGLVNHSKWKKYQIFTEDYAIINDAAQNYLNLHYYIDQISQRRQLESSNFTVIDVYDITGNELASTDLDTKSPWLYYVATKSPDPAN